MQIYSRVTISLPTKVRCFYKDFSAGKQLSIQVAELDLSDLQSVTQFAKYIKYILNGRPLDLLVGVHDIGIILT